MFTAIIATVGAVFGYMGGATQANAGLYKNNAAIKRLTSNQWNYFQSKAPNNHWPSWPATSHLTTRRQLTNPGWIVTRRRKAKSRVIADKLEADATQWDKQSDEQMHQHHRWAQSTTVLRVSIALAAIALLTKRSGWSTPCLLPGRSAS
ncbi:MAG: DUF4337 family protein [Rhodoferax sp.]|nr:DUF4337 family protein [Rhodoferax sp.]